jgi:hypothetical protein
VGFGIPHIVCHLAAVAVAKLRSTAENRITGFEKVEEVSKKTVAGDGGGWFPVDFDGAAEGVDAVGWREAAGGRRSFTLWVKRRNGFDRAHPD